MKEIPEDIYNRIIHDFNSVEVNYVVNKLLTLYSIKINVGIEQLMRSILVIINGETSLLDKIFSENFYNDPRDIIIEAMEINNKINYGLKEFE